MYRENVEYRFFYEPDLNGAQKVVETSCGQLWVGFARGNGRCRSEWTLLEILGLIKEVISKLEPELVKMPPGKRIVAKNG